MDIFRRNYLCMNHFLDYESWCPFPKIQLQLSHVTLNCIYNKTLMILPLIVKVHIMMTTTNHKFESKMVSKILDIHFGFTHIHRFVVALYTQSFLEFFSGILLRWDSNPQPLQGLKAVDTIVSYSK